MIDAKTIADALGGKRYGNGYRSSCPVCGGSDKSTKFIMKDHGDRVLIHCFAGCDFIDVAAELRRRGLWPEPEKLPIKQAREYRRKKTREQIEEALNHELNVLLQFVGWRVADRHVKTPRPGWKPLPKEHWEREILAVKRIQQALEVMYG